MFITHELPPTWTENKEVLPHLRGEVNPLSSIKPTKLSRTNNLIFAFCNTYICLMAQKHIPELCSKITPDNYLEATFQWFHTVNQQLRNAAQKVQQYKDLNTEFEERNKFITVMYISKDTLMATISKSLVANTSPLMFLTCMHLIIILPQSIRNPLLLWVLTHSKFTSKF